VKIHPDQDPNDGTILQIRFKQFKEDLQVFAQRRAAENLGALEKARSALQTERDQILNEPCAVASGSPALDAEKDRAARAAAGKQRRINKILAVQRDKHKLRTRASGKTQIDNCQIIIANYR
jgi:hypothetical protein